MKKIAFLLAAVLFTFLTHASTPCSEFAYGGQLPQAREPHVILCKREFAIGYSTSRRTPLFIVQRLDPEKITMPSAIQSASFRQDPTISKDHQPALSDFSNTGYDRGHMAPFEDNNHDAEAARESNYLTNIVPQHAGNNRGIWRVLESRVRDMSLDGEIFVITGPIFDDGESQLVIGVNKIPVPSRLFKVIINPSTRLSYSYIVPNAAVPSSMLDTFITSRQHVIEATGIDIIPSITLTDSR